VDEHSLDATELAQEHTLNAGDRVLMVLVDGPAYPADIVVRTGDPLGTVKNALTSLRKRGLVEDTGEADPHTKAKEVRLTNDGLSVTASQLSKESVTPVTPPDPPAGVIVNDRGEIEF
jgi:hypothetical protein